MSEKKNLKDFGDKIQYRFVKSLIEKPSTFAEVEPYLNPSAFDNPGLVTVIKAMKAFYKENGHTPSYVDLEYQIKSTVKDEDADAAYTAFQSVKTDSEYNDGLEMASGIGIETVKRMEFLRRMKNGIDSIKTSGYSDERARRILDDAGTVLLSSVSSCFNPIDMLEETLNEPISERIRTGIPEIDAVLRGGMPRGTTGMLVAPTGIGKTTFLSIIACNAVLLGYKVLYIFFEDKDTDFCRKFYSCITERPTSEFGNGNEEAKEEIRRYFRENPEVRENMKNNIKVKRMPNGETTVDMIKNEYGKLASAGFKPDMVIIDYLGCIQPSTDKKLAVEKEYQVLDRSMKILDSLAQENGFALWVAQQTNREGAKRDTKDDGMANISGSWRLTHTPSAIFYLTRDSDTDYNRINLSMEKCRWNPPCSWKGAYMNNGTCQIDLSDTDETRFSDVFAYNNKDERDKLGL